MRGVSLKGLRVLVLEEEVLIALDLEQICRDFGAAQVTVARTLDEAEAAGADFDVAIIDVMLACRSTLDFAAGLRARDVPFLLSTGYSDAGQLVGDRFDVEIVDKPFSGTTLVAAIVTTLDRHHRNRF